MGRTSSARSSSPSRSASRSPDSHSNSNNKSPQISSTPVSSTTPSQNSPQTVVQQPSMMQNIASTAAGVAIGNAVSSVLIGSSKKESDTHNNYSSSQRSNMETTTAQMNISCSDSYNKMSSCITMNRVDVSNCQDSIDEFIKCYDSTLNLH